MKNLVQRKLTWLCLSLFTHHRSSLCFSNSNDLINFLILGFNLIEFGWIEITIKFHHMWLKFNSFYFGFKWKNRWIQIWNPIQFNLVESISILVKLNWMLLNSILWVESISWKFRKHSHQMVDFLVDYYHDVKNFLIWSKMKGTFVLFILSWGKKMCWHYEMSTIFVDGYKLVDIYIIFMSIKMFMILTLAMWCKYDDCDNKKNKLTLIKPINGNEEIFNLACFFFFFLK